MTKIKIILFATILLFFLNYNLAATTGSVNNSNDYDTSNLKDGLKLALSTTAAPLFIMLLYAFIPEKISPSASLQATSGISSIDTNQLRRTILPPIPTVHHNNYTARASFRNIETDAFFKGFGLISKSSKKCMDIPQGSSDNNIKPEIWTCNYQENQKFTLDITNRESPPPFLIPIMCFGHACPTGLGRPLFHIVGKGSRKCFDVADNSDVVQYDCSDPSKDNQLWYLKWWKGDLGLGWFSLVSMSNKECLTVYEGKDFDGEILNTYTCQQSDNQLWSFV